MKVEMNTILHTHSKIEVPHLPDEIWETIYNSGLFAPKTYWPIIFNKWSMVFFREIENVQSAYTYEDYDGYDPDYTEDPWCSDCGIYKGGIGCSCDPHHCTSALWGPDD